LAESVGRRVATGLVVRIWAFRVRAKSHGSQQMNI
jgi:hypothetical protein